MSFHFLFSPDTRATPALQAAFVNDTSMANSLRALTINTLNDIASIDVLFVVYGFLTPTSSKNSFVIAACVVLSSPDLDLCAIHPGGIQEVVERCFSASEEEVQEEIVQKLRETVRGDLSENTKANFDSFPSTTRSLVVTDRIPSVDLTI